ncbi:MAG: hypothetical protein EG823_09460 [Actinobacteria bacterium]|nr:hypothetical protein [Actinomycetota bacterium]
MARERWAVLAKVRGEFVITDGALTADAEPGQRVKRLELTPEFDDEGQYTGLHALTVEIDIDNPDESPLPGHIPLEAAKDVAESTAAAISLATGRPVALESVSVRYDLAESGKHRLVIGASQAVSIAPPSVFDPTLLTVAIDRKARRVIRWWARGIAAADGVERLSALTTALDLIAGDHDAAPTRTRVCTECGHAEALAPGLREREIAYLKSLGYDEDTAALIYESRIDLAHGRTDLSEDDLRRFRQHADLLAEAIRRGLGERLGIALPPTPQSLPFDLPSAQLDVEYTDPPGD